MKKLFLIAFVPLLMLTYCSDDKDDDKGPKYEFMSQDIQGVINGQQWVANSGLAEEGFEANELWIELTDESYTDVCAEFFLEGIEIFFTIDSAVGVYELGINFNTLEGQTVTFYSDGLNNVAVEGAVEIMSISGTEVSGRIDARIDGDNKVNGNFTVPYCASE